MTRAMFWSIVIDQSWINIRNKTGRGYDFYFGSYYHKRDYLKSVDWEPAMVSYDDNGNKVRVFLMTKREDVTTDARLMVIQKPDGVTGYSIRLKSQDATYTSVYSANDKMLYVGTTQGNQGNIFKPTGVMALKGTGIPGMSFCDGCHSGEGNDYPGGGGGSICGNNLLGDVVIVDEYPDYVWPEKPNLWERTIIIIAPGNEDNNDNNIDNNPCTRFKSLMVNQQFRQKLQELINNTTYYRNRIHYER